MGSLRSLGRTSSSWAELANRLASVGEEMSECARDLRRECGLERVPVSTVTRGDVAQFMTRVGVLSS